MKSQLLWFLFILFFPVVVLSQQTTVKGSVLDELSGRPIPNVTVSIENTSLSIKTDADGTFIFLNKLPLGEQVLRVEKVGYVTKRYPIIINQGETVDISGMILDYNQSDKSDL